MLPEIGVVLDAGTGMFRVRDHLCTPTLDIFLTHAHLDHVIGLTYLLDVLYGRSMQRVTIHAAADKLAAIDQHLLAEDLFPVKLPYQWQPLTSPVPLAQSGMLTFFPVDHPGNAVGFRLDWPGHSLAYVTDTTASPKAAYVENIRGADLLVHECYFPDGWEEHARRTGHSCTTPVLQTAAAAGVKRLVLMHVNPLLDSADPLGLSDAKKIFANTQLSYDGMQLEF